MQEQITEFPASAEGLALLVKELRKPYGCPWDRKQTIESLRSSLTGECADPWNWKTVRATMGACFRLPAYEVKRQNLPALLERSGLPLYATALREDTVDLRDADLSRCAVVIGSEGRGVCEGLLAMSEKTLKIPMRDRCESLNAASAATVVLWEMAR